MPVHTGNRGLPRKTIHRRIAQAACSLGRFHEDKIWLLCNRKPSSIRRYTGDCVIPRRRFSLMK
jgi:hypothetical protein